MENQKDILEITSEVNPNQGVKTVDKQSFVKVYLVSISSLPTETLMNHSNSKYFQYINSLTKNLEIPKQINELYLINLKNVYGRLNPHHE